MRTSFFCWFKVKFLFRVKQAFGGILFFFLYEMQNGLVGWQFDFFVKLAFKRAFGVPSPETIFQIE
jgi:hypothetical protein